MPIIEEKPPEKKPIAEKHNVIIGHHPCPDGIAGLYLLSKKFAKKDSISFHGLNHSDLETMKKKIDAILLKHPKNANIIFVDITPPFEILKNLFKESSGTVTLLDHHETAIHEFELHKHALEECLSSGRLQMDFDLKRSGAGIAHDFVFGKKTRPTSISLVQTMDLLTATGNTDILNEFKISDKDVSPEVRKILNSLADSTSNKLIKKYIDFYFFSAILDSYLKKLFSQYGEQIEPSLLEIVSDLFESIDKNGLSFLLSTEHGKNFITQFREQLKYQKEALERAIIIPSLIRDDLDVLFIDADLKTGRTFDLLITDFLKKLSRPAIAMVTKINDIKEDNWIPLRAASDEFDLAEIASEYKEKGIAVNAGGHVRASALQLNKKQMDHLLSIVFKCSISHEVKTVGSGPDRNTLFGASFLTQARRLLNNPKSELDEIILCVNHLEKSFSKFPDKKLDIHLCCAEFYGFIKTKQDLLIHEEYQLDHYYEILKIIQKLEFDHIINNLPTDQQVQINFIAATAISNLIDIYLNRADMNIQQKLFVKAITQYNDAKQLVNLFSKYGNQNQCLYLRQQIDEKIETLSSRVSKSKEMDLTYAKCNIR